MTSEERRAARRIRREEKRRKKKEAVNEKYGKLENVFDYGNLLEAFDKSKNGSSLEMQRTEIRSKSVAKDV